MIRLLFFIGALNRGGAERQLALLAKEIDQTRFAVTVVTAVDGGSLRPEIEAVGGIDVLSLRKRGHWDILRPVWRLIRILWRIRPHIVHGYMNSANVLILPVGKLAGAKVVWGLRASNVDFSLYGRRASLMFHLAE